jgi:hypothetical protein
MPKPPHHTTVFLLRLSPAEKAAWTAAAQRRHESVSSWLRFVAASYIRERAEEDQLAKEFARASQKRKTRARR